MTAGPVDPVTLEVVRNALIEGVAAMKQTVLRTAYSRLWKEAGDVSCGVLDPHFELIAQGKSDIPVHLGAMPLSVAGAVDAFGSAPLDPDDILWHNDPYRGNNHLPDLIMVKPIFVSGEVIAYSAVRGHYVDIGGSTPGSNSPVVYDLHAEGFRLQPVKIYRRGVLNRDVLDVFLSNTRNPDECRGDFRAQHAACIVGEQRVLELVEKYGLTRFKQSMAMILDHSERLVRSRIMAISDGSYEFIDYLDDDGHARSRIPISSVLRIEGDSLTVDLSGSAEQSSSAMNCPLSVTHAAVNYAIKTYLCQDPENPPNSGSYRPVTIIAPRGTVVNPEYPAAVAAGNTDAGYRILDAVLGAIAKAIPDQAVAAGNGGSCCLIVAGTDSRPGMHGRHFNWLEPNGSSHGASSCADGTNATRWGIGNTGNTPIEIVEANEPLYVEELAIAPNIGGAGKYRGGMPIRRRMRVLVDCAAIWCLERVTLAPWGLQGGGSGAMGEIWVEKKNGSRTALPAKTEFLNLAAGDLLEIRMAGGGGYGHPFDRDPEAVRSDVLDGYFSRAVAEREFGVIFRDPTSRLLEIDMKATADRRKAVGAEA